MSWHYQLIKDKDGVGLHEVYMDGTAYTEDPISFYGDSKEEILESLKQAIQDIEKYPVLEFNKI